MIDEKGEHNTALPTMPKRTRSHILETESWDALCNVIPKSWVLRESKPDYGIDGEIEIFDTSGNSTSLIFYFQLKATDINDKKKALNYRFKKETIIYYKSFQVPILLIRYISATKELYFKWANAIDFYYSKEDSKTINVRFDETGKWNRDTNKELLNCLLVFQRFKNPSLKTPLLFHLSSPEKIYNDIPKGILVSTIKEIFDSEEIVKLSLEPPSLSALVIYLKEDVLYISIAGTNCFHIHYQTDNYFTKDNIEKIPHDILVGIAVCLSAFGHDYLSADIVGKHLPLSSILNNTKLLSFISSIYFKSKRFDLAIKTAELMLKKFPESNIYELFILPIYLTNKVNNSVFDAVLKFFQNLLEKEEKKNYKEVIGTVNYNIGKLYNKPSDDRRSLRKAFYHYLVASKNDPKYKKRHYFWSEIGQILHNLHRYKCASKFYSKAIDMGTENSLIAYQADSLMFAGEYGKSYRLFTKYLKKDDDANPEWILKHYLLKNILHNIKAKNQSRKIDEARKHAYVDDDNAHNRENRLEKAIELDSLCVTAWFNLGIFYSLKKDYDSAINSFIYAGVLCKHDVESLANAILLMLVNGKQTKLLGITISFAYNENGQQFTNEVIKKINEQMGDNYSIDKYSEFINIIVEAIHASKRKSHNQSIIRMHNTSDHSFSTLRLDNDGGLIFE